MKLPAKVLDIETSTRHRRDFLTALALDAGAGDRASENELLRALAPKMVAIVRATLSETSNELDDVVQDALLALVRGLPTFRGEGKIEHYAARLTLRAAITARRRIRAIQQRTDVAHRPDETASRDSSSSPDDQVEIRRRREVIVSLLETLPEEQAEVLGLRVVLGHSLQEVASMTGAPVNTVRSRIRLAKDALRKRIEAEPSLARSLEVMT